MEKKLMLIINPSAGKGAYKVNLGEALQVLDMGDTGPACSLPPAGGTPRSTPPPMPGIMTPWPASAGTAPSAKWSPD